MPVGEVIDIGIDKDKPSILIKAHRLRREHANANPLILVVRNYKEVIPRHLASVGKLSLKSFKNKFDGATKGIGNDGVDYVGCIQSYEMCNRDKLFIPYEDIIEKPRPTITSIIEFLGHDTSGIDDFFKKYKWHVGRGISAYHDRSHSKGKDLTFHSRRLSQDLRKHMDERLETKFPKLFESYLRRYKEDD
jgi:hypothetical protein